MTNGIPELASAVELAPGVQWDGVIHEPTPWAWLFLLTLWLAVAIVVTTGIVVGIMKKRRGQPTASLSKRVLMVSTCVLCLGTGVILWSLAAALANVSFYSSIPPKAMLQMSVVGICHSLYSLAINIIMAGVGFVVAIWLKDNKHKNPNQVPKDAARKFTDPQH